MARKKEINEVENPGVAETNAPEVENQTIEMTTNESEVESGVAETNAPEVVEDTPAELPDYVKRVLKVFNNHAELYVDTVGKVFTADTKPSLYGNAILYKNPFYNSK